jgi:MFS family permease
MHDTSFNHRKVILFLGILNALTPFTIDLYLPAFADIAQDMNTNVARVSLSVATYFIGYAIGQLVYGPFLDLCGTYDLSSRYHWLHDCSVHRITSHFPFSFCSWWFSGFSCGRRHGKGLL